MNRDEACRTLVLMKQHAQCLDGVLAGGAVALLLGPFAFGLGLVFMPGAVGRHPVRLALASVAAIGVVAIASLALALLLRGRQDQAIAVIVSALMLSVPIQTVIAVASLLIVALRQPNP